MVGMKNRERGLRKKAHTYFRLFAGDVLVILRRPDGRYTGYQSRPGLIREFLPGPENELLGPDDFDDKATSVSGFATDDCISSPPSQPESLRSSSAGVSSTTSASTCSISTNCTASIRITAATTPCMSPNIQFWADLDLQDMQNMQDTLFEGCQHPKPEGFCQVSPRLISTPLTHQPLPISESKKKAAMSLLDKYL
ncbi:hypothetical protein X797_011545 [Metarhizium robertsii]|uniref:MADS-box domain-containing protein n=1 Tax=Metarhizium robertsii TaxID=568076 RepID=A0A014P241_9HYPO|nr:hypothetical protein X797_011545 [Metarhizium robertsii]